MAPTVKHQRHGRSLTAPTPRSFPTTISIFIVEQTTGELGVPLRVNELALSSHGATVDFDGEWVDGLLAAYRHRAINGRDLHVEIVTRGYLAPFGHAASLTTLTERLLRTDSPATSPPR